jgi:hypothetical protein
MTAESGYDAEAIGHLRKFMDGPMWEPTVERIRREIGDAAIAEPSREMRDELFYEYKALDRIVGRLTALVNGARMSDPRTGRTG